MIMVDSEIIWMEHPGILQHFLIAAIRLNHGLLPQVATTFFQFTQTLIKGIILGVKGYYNLSS